MHAAFMKFSVDVFIDPGHFKNSVIHILGTLCYLFLDGTLKTQTGVQENSMTYRNLILRP